jgi:hypothetical protein
MSVNMKLKCYTSNYRENKKHTYLVINSNCNILLVVGTVF